MLLRIGNDGPQSVCVAEDAGVTHLTAAFAVERCLVGDDIHRVAHASAIDARAVPDDRDDLALTLFGGITDEFGAALFLDEIEPQFVRRLVARSLPCRPRGAALLGHRGLRSEEHTSELQSLMRISYAVFCLKKKTKN